ncbi:cytochrome P450 [Crucibulum laeve]|uniref:Cytochrome P450 n=1 Tax=Crucibulum laeve TaxID=68775 RepID=A0A5C3LVM9_9AGAR|nr:cytochrome P450 [Crucibulum laeve]
MSLFLEKFLTSYSWLVFFLFLLLFVLLCAKEFTVPSELRHLPKVPILSLLYSYARGEVEDSRIRRLLLPFANKHREDIIIKDLSHHIVQWPKEEPPDQMLLWRFIGQKNIILSNGELWKRHSRVVKSALNKNIPIADFVYLTNKLFSCMPDQGLVRWDELTMRFTLDAVGTTALGYNFNTLDNPDSPFIKQYNAIMDGIASPAHLVFPKIETWFPRRKLIALIDDLVDKFHGILEYKKNNKGNDMLTYMLEEPDMTDEEYRDNMVVFFIAGHDTTAGALSSLAYYFAKHPDIQELARSEVLKILGPTEEPTLDKLRNLPFLDACIRESLRINTPITYMVPRVSSAPTELRGSSGKVYLLPANTSTISNIYAVHHNEHHWPDPGRFDPRRFLNLDKQKEKTVDASLWMPFYVGPRQCPARNFAMYELRTLSSMLLRQYSWTLPSNSPHNDWPQNAFSPFALSLPRNMDLNFIRQPS